MSRKPSGAKIEEKVFDKSPSSPSSPSSQDIFAEPLGMGSEEATAEAVHCLVGQDLEHPEALTEMSADEIPAFALAEAAYSKLQSPMLRAYLDYEYKLRASKDRASRHELTEISKSFGAATQEARQGVLGKIRGGLFG